MAHPMMMKALLGLEALKSLRGDAKLVDDATSRAYYAFYHACWAFLQTRKPPVPFDVEPGYVGEPDSYRHNRLGEKLAKCPEFPRGAGNNWLKLLFKARSNRRKADYALEMVDQRILNDLAEKIDTAVRGVDKILRE